MKQPTPACAISMAATERGSWRQRGRRAARSLSVLASTQTPSSRPVSASGLRAPLAQAIAATPSSVSSSGARRLRRMSRPSARCQRTKGPTPSSSATGAIRGTKTASK